jgi:DNA-directed RNA polymerase subunit RPC12/RpoP
MLKVKCEKCGKKPDQDDSKSNVNWTEFNLKAPCKECGGKIIIDVGIVK